MATVSTATSYTARVRVSRLDGGGWEIWWALAGMMLPMAPYLVIPMLLSAPGGGQERSTFVTVLWVSLAMLASVGGVVLWFTLAARWPRLDDTRWFHALTRIRLDASGLELEGLAPMPWAAVRSVMRESVDGDSVLVDTIPFKGIRVHLPVDEALPVFEHFLRIQALHGVPYREAPRWRRRCRSERRRIAPLPASDKALFLEPDTAIARRETSPATPAELKQLQPLARGEMAGWFLPMLEAFVLVPLLATTALLIEQAIGHWVLHDDWDQPGTMRLTLWIAAVVFVLWIGLRRWIAQRSARHRHWQAVLAKGEVELERHQLEQAIVLWAPLPLGEDEPEPVNPTRGIAWIVAPTAEQRWLVLRHDQAGLPSHVAHGASWLSSSGNQLAPRQSLDLVFAPRTHRRIDTRCDGERVPVQITLRVMPRAEAEQLERAANVEGILPPSRFGLVDASDVAWLTGLLRRMSSTDSR